MPTKYLNFHFQSQEYQSQGKEDEILFYIEQGI